jgi:hypothetical protein
MAGRRCNCNRFVGFVQTGRDQVAVGLHDEFIRKEENANPPDFDCSFFFGMSATATNHPRAAASAARRNAIASTSAAS